MLIHLKHVLGNQELKKVQELLAKAHFVDGKLSAGKVAAQVKINQEVAGDDPMVSMLNEIVMGNLLRHKTYLQGALPLYIASPFYACYEKDMEYGDHIDDPIMGLKQRYRSDLALTIFLNQPDEYEGGELIIKTGLGEQPIKFAAGDAVLYPATSRHRVSKVTNGKRMVAVSWVQSLVKDNEQRSLLYQLGCAREKLLRNQPEEEHTKQIDNVYVNLVRKWSEL